MPEQEPDLSLEEEVQAGDRTLSDFAVQKSIRASVWGVINILMNIFVYMICLFMFNY